MIVYMYIHNVYLLLCILLIGHNLLLTYDYFMNMLSIFKKILILNDPLRSKGCNYLSFLFVGSEVNVRSLSQLRQRQTAEGRIIIQSRSSLISNGATKIKISLTTLGRRLTYRIPSIILI